MEKEKFESINKTFNYTPNSVFTNQWSSLAFGIGMVVVPLIFLSDFVSGVFIYCRLQYCQQFL